MGTRLRCEPRPNPTQPPPRRTREGTVGAYPVPSEGGKLTQTAQETFDIQIRAVISRQLSVLVWFAMRERHGKAL